MEEAFLDPSAPGSAELLGEVGVKSCRGRLGRGGRAEQSDPRVIGGWDNRYPHFFLVLGSCLITSKG